MEVSGSDSGKLVTSCATDVGHVRQSNQDDFGEFENDAGCKLLVVADGMGGHAGGEVAARTCVERVGEVFRSASGNYDAVLRRALEDANDCVYRMGVETPGLRGMGTTAVAIVFDPAQPDTAWVAHVGDSRAYRLHDGRLQRLTDDHSWVFEEVRRKRITPEEAEVHPRRNALLRSIGVDAGIEVDVQRVPVAAGDRFVLCSDGLWGEVRDPAIASLMAEHDPETATRELIERANLNGGRDNITVVFAEVPDSRGATAGTPPPSGRPQPPGLAGRGRTLGIAAVVAGIAIVVLTWIALGSG